MLYWHVADSQSFPLEVEGFEELAEKGAYSDQEIYSVRDMQRVVDYANQACFLLTLCRITTDTV